jgi:hypothetical protein
VSVKLPLPRKLGNVTAPELCEIIAASRCRLSNESQTQADIHAALCARMPALASGVVRELRLSSRDRVDIWANGIVIEVKLGAARAMDIFRQMSRYAGHDAVEALILATNKAIALPPSINGKPAYVLSLGRAWL